MSSIIILTILSFFLFSLLLTLNHFKKEMESKMLYQDYIDDAIDGIYNDFTSNRKYAFPSVKGLVFYEDKSGELSVKSQSKLHGYSIDK